jgi:hypothetical protein
MTALVCRGNSTFLPKKSIQRTLRRGSCFPAPGAKSLRLKELDVFPDTVPHLFLLLALPAQQLADVKKAVEVVSAGAEQASQLSIRDEPTMETVL